MAEEGLSGLVAAYQRQFVLAHGPTHGKVEERDFEDIIRSANFKVLFKLDHILSIEGTTEMYDHLKNQEPSMPLAVLHKTSSAISVNNGMISDASIIECLITESQKSESHQITSVYLLSSLTKNSTTSSMAYIALPKVCASSQSLFLFIHLHALTNGKKKPGWGTGMKKAILNWYLSFEAKKLKIEIARCPSAFKLNHKDIIRLAHIKLDTLPIGHQVMLYHALYGYAKTKDTFQDKTDASEYILFLTELYPGKGCIDAEDSESSAKSCEKRASIILNEMQHISIQDFPSQMHQQPEVWECLMKNKSLQHMIKALITSRLPMENESLEDLIVVYLNTCDSSQVDPIDLIAAFNKRRQLEIKKTKYGKKSGLGPTRTINFNPDKRKVTEALSGAIVKRAKLFSSPLKSANVMVTYHAGIFEYPEASAKWDPVDKITGIQYFTYLIIRLAAGSRRDIITPYICLCEDYVFLPLKELKDFRWLDEEFKIYMRGDDVEWWLVSHNYTVLLEKTERAAKDTCIICVHELTFEIIEEANSWLNTKPSDYKMRVILVGSKKIRHSQLLAPQDYHGNLLCVSGYDALALDAISAFHNQQH